jgi:hypothetical protein
MAQDKVKTVLEWPEPRKVKDVVRATFSADLIGESQVRYIKV